MTEAIRGETGLDQETQYEPFILAIIGLPLHGKTTLATELARNSNLMLLDVDEARATLFPERIVGQTMPSDEERFVMLTSYQSMHERARDAILGGQPVVIAGAYTRRIYHEMLYDLQKVVGVPLMVVLLECSEDQIRARLQKRSQEKTLSNIKTFEQYLGIKERYERMQGAVVLDSGQPIETVAVDLTNLLGRHQV